MLKKFDLIDIVPILGSDITKYREEVHDRIILNAILSLERNIFTIDELNDRINHLFDISYPRERLVHNLEILFNDQIEYSNGKIQINESICPIPNEINDLIEACFKEFIKSMKDDYEPHLIERYHKAFYDLIHETFKNIIGSMNIIKLDMDTVDFKSNTEKMNEILIHDIIPNPWKFLNYYYDYLSSDSPIKDKIIITIFQYAISVDILSRGSELFTASKEYKEKGILIIDTNIMTALLLKSNRFHETVNSMISLSYKMGFRIFYTVDTALEFQRLIDGANYNITKRKSFSELDRDNELVFDYLKDGSVQNWSDKLIYYNSFRLILERDYGITILDEEIVRSDSDFTEFLREVYRISMMTHKQRLPLAIEHDIRLFTHMYSIKNRDITMMFNSPWILTLDNLLIYISGYVRRRKDTDCDYCIHAQKWFDLLIPFCDIEDVKKNQRNFVTAILKYSIIPFNNKLSLDEYTKLLANKFGLEGANSDLILKIISKSRLQFQLESSLERNNVNDTKNITYEIFTDDRLIDELLEKSEDKKTIERLKESIRKSRLESEALKLQRDLYKELLLRKPDIEEIYKMISEIQTNILKADPEFFNIYKIDMVKKEELEKSNATDYLEKLSSFIEKRSRDVRNLTLIQSKVIVLYEYLKEFI